MGCIQEKAPNYGVKNTNEARNDGVRIYMEKQIQVPAENIENIKA